MSIFIRAALPVVLAAVLLASLAPAPVSAGQSASRAESRLHTLINQARTERGLVALRWDRRLADIAQFRSNDMVKNKYFAHPSSSEMAALLKDKGIVWKRWGETIAWNMEDGGVASAERAFKQWRNSAPHWDLITSDNFNYIAIGVAPGKDGRYVWTALYLKGPDRTKPRASMAGVDKGSASAGKRKVSVSWKGHDVKLQVLTAGLKDFKLQRRVGSGEWKAVTNWTTARSRTFELSVGKTYRFRVRARDNVGNKSTWSTVLTVKP